MIRLQHISPILMEVIPAPVGGILISRGPLEDLARLGLFIPSLLRYKVP